MNTLKQIADLNNKLPTIMEQNKGVVTLTFYNNKKVTVRVLGASTNYDFANSTYQSILKTFTTDINKVTEYDMSEIQDIN